MIPLPEVDHPAIREAQFLGRLKSTPGNPCLPARNDFRYQHFTRPNWRRLSDRNAANLSQHGPVFRFMLFLPCLL